MIRHALPSSTVPTIPLGVHGAASRSCLIAAPSFPLTAAAGLLRAGSDAVESGLDHTADRQERESDSAHTETPCKKLHRHTLERMSDVSKARTPHLSGSSTFIDPLEALTL